MNLLRAFLVTIFLNISLLFGADVCMTTFDKYFTAPSDSYTGAITALDDSFDSGSDYTASWYFNVPMDGTIDFIYTTTPDKTDFYYALNGCASDANTSLANGNTITVAEGDELYIYTETDKNFEFSFTTNYTSIDYYALDDSGETNGTEVVVIDILDNDHSESSTIDPTTVTIDTNVTKGNLVIDPATGVATYTPGGGFNLAGDFFTYTVDTIAGDTTNIATVTITYPTAIAYDKFYSVAPDANISGNLITDAPINYNMIDILEMNSNTAPAEGTLSAVSSDGNFTYLAPSAETTTSFTYSIKNSYGMVSNTATATIYINNYCGDAITLLTSDGNCSTYDVNSTNDSVTEYAQYYSIVLNETGRLDINLTNKDLEAAKTTLYYDFGDQCGTIFAKGTTSQIDAGYPSEFASMILGAGTYTLGLYGVSKNNPVEYHVDVNFTSACTGQTLFPTNTGAIGVNNLTYDYSLDKNITTKIVDKPFGLRTTYLDSSGSVAAYSDQGTGESMVVTISHSDGATCSNPVELTSLIFNDGDIFFDLPETLIIDSASKDKRIRTAALDYSQLLSDASGLNCGRSSLDSALCMVPACFNSTDNILSVFPPAFQPNVMTCIYGDGGGNAPCDSDAYYGSCGGTKGNVSPEKYNVYNGCAACLADAVNAPCSVDEFAVRPNEFNSTITPFQIFEAGVETPLTFYANKYGGVGAPDYNELEDSSFLVDVNISDASKLCEEMSIKFDEDVDFTDGETDPTTLYALHNVGDFDVTIYEPANATYNEFAYVDRDDTTDTERLINPYTQQIKVVPDHFEIDGNLTNGSNDFTFTYLNNFKANATLDQNISALMNWNVIARTEGNITTTNYTSDCYAKDGNITLTLVLSQAISDLNQSLSKLLWYDDENGTIIGSVSINAALILPNYTAERFEPGDSNGTGNFRYRLNFDRNVTKVVNPFLMRISNLRVDDDDSATGNGALDNNATYIYGRTHASRQRYVGPTGTANIYYEAYCFGSTCNKTLLNGFSTLKSTDDMRWFINNNHTSPNDGAVGTVTERGAANVGASAPSNANPATTNLTYNTSQGYPYKTTMQNAASTWLIYNKDDPTATQNEFQVEFSSSSGWSGEHDIDTTTKDVGNIRTNRRSNW